MTLRMPTLRALGQQFAADRNITHAEVNQLVAKVKQNGIVSRAERLELRSLIAQHRDNFEPGALQTLQNLLGSLPAIRSTTTGNAARLSPSDAARPVFITEKGQFSLTASGAAPRTDSELGDTFFRAAELVDDAPGNVFLDMRSPLSQRQGAFEQVKGALTRASSLPADQSLQLRASSTTVLLHLLEATPEAGPREQMLKSYEALVRTEPNKFAREVAIFHLSNSAAAETSPVKKVAESLMKELTPTTPPYEKWFANGNRTVNMQWTVGEVEFWKNFVGGLKRDGFKPVGPENQHGISTYEKTFNEPGIGETTFRIQVKEGGRNMLESIANPGVHIIGYDGHASWGKNIKNSIRGGPTDASGGDGKLFVDNSCVGKSGIDALREKYPNLQSVSTFGSSYLDTDINGLAQEIAKRADWQSLDAYFNRTDGFHDRQNFITPVGTLMRERVLDRDNDGQADYLDKHFNYSQFDVPTDTTREFRPVVQDRDAKTLDGTKINVAAQVINTVSEFSSILERVNSDSKVVPTGWFDPKMGEKEMFRFTLAKGPDGRTEFRMGVSSRYAHMSEEALRASAVYEFGRWLGTSGQLRMDPVDAKLNGLIGFAQSLDIDEGQRDAEVWKNFLGTYNLPAVDQQVIQRLLDAEHRHYAGSPQMVAALKAQLSPEILAQLARPEVGERVTVIG